MRTPQEATSIKSTRRNVELIPYQKIQLLAKSSRHLAQFARESNKVKYSKWVQKPAKCALDRP